MANSFKNTSLVLKETLAHLENELCIANVIRTDLDENYTDVGDTVTIRRPQRFVGQSNNLDVSSYNEDIVEGGVAVTMDQTETIKFEIEPKDMTLKVDSSRFRERYIQPAVTKLKDRIETALAAQYYKFYHFSGTPGTVPATFKSLGLPGAILTDAAIPKADRYAFHNTTTALELADSLKGVYVSGKAKTAFEEVQMGRYGGFTNMECVHVPTHTVGALGGTPLVNGASQNDTYADTKDTNTSSLVTDGWSNSVTGVVKQGDVITLAGVYAVNPITKQSTGRLQTFTIMADANSDGSGNATLTVAPAIISSGAWQNVSAAPADDAAITIKTGSAGTAYPQSLLLHKDAMCLVSRPLKISNAGLKTTTMSGNKVTLSMTEWGDGNTLKHNFRLDMLFGVQAFPDHGGLRLTA